MNSEILKALLTGATYEEIGKQAGLSRQRIHQIAAELTPSQRSVREQAKLARRRAQEEEILRLARMGLSNAAIKKRTRHGWKFVSAVRKKYGIPAATTCPFRCDHDQIRADAMAGMRNPDIAKKHGITPNYASAVVNGRAGRSWKRAKEQTIDPQP